MIELQGIASHYRQRFEDLDKQGVSGACAWLQPIRAAAMKCFEELGFPTTKHEEWRHTNITAISGTPFDPASPGAASVTASQLAPFLTDLEGSPLLVFVNGRFAPSLSSLDGIVEGVTVCSLAEALVRGDAALEPHLTHHAGFHDHPFVALNTALFEDGAMISLPKDCVFEKPIQILYVTSPCERASVCHPRTLILAGPNSQATIVETYAGLGQERYFTNPVTELVAQENAVVDHYRIIREGGEGLHVSALQVQQQRSSNVASSNVCLGARLVRNNIHAMLDGEGSECTLNGIYFAVGQEHVDNHLRVEHVKAHCDSREYFKGVLNDEASGVFTGRIFVHEGAQKTDAKQTNMSLLLSDSARVQSKPQLEIFADDVKCTHGATVGQVDEAAVFYLRTRGLNESAARNLMVYAFAKENLDRIRIEPLRAQLEELLLARLPQGETIGR